MILSKLTGPHPKRWTLPWVFSGFGKLKSEGNYLNAQALTECLAQMCSVATHKENISAAQLNTVRGVMYGASIAHTALGTQAGAAMANGEAARAEMKAAHEEAIKAGKGNWLQWAFTWGDHFYRMGAQPIAAALFSTLLGISTAGTYYRGAGEKGVHRASAVMAQVFNALYCWSTTSQFREKVTAMPEAIAAQAEATAREKAAELARVFGAGAVPAGS